MVITLGVILILIAVVGFIAPLLGLEHPALEKIGTLKAQLGLGALGLIMMLGVNGLFFKADASTDYVLQYPWGGTKTYVNTNGIKPRLWADIIAIDHEIIVKHLVPSSYRSYEEGRRIESENTYVLAAGEYEFNDFISGHMGSTVVITSNPDASSGTFEKLAINSKSEMGLVYGRIIPIISAAKKNTSKLMSAQEYIAGRSSDFDKFFIDQLRYGTYELVEQRLETQVDSVLDGSDLTVNQDAKTSSIAYVIKRDKAGNPIRINEGLTRYGLEVRQADADDQSWEERFLTRLNRLKDIVAEKQQEIEAAQMAVERKKRLIEEGEANKAEEQAKLEKEQIQLVIAAETERRVAEEKKKAAEVLKQTAEIDAQRIKTLADAQAYQNKRLVSAGLTPQERAEWEFKTTQAVAAEIAKLKLPATYIAPGGGNGQSSGLLEALIGAELAKKMAVSDGN